MSSLKYIIGGVLVIAIAIWVFGSISSENLTYYYTPTEVSQNYKTIQDQTIRIMGLVKKGSINWSPRDTKLTFEITDENQNALAVQYIGAKPDMFREGQGVVVEGRLDSIRSFAATNLLVKHNEEYTTIEHKQQKKDYYNSLQE